MRGEAREDVYTQIMENEIKIITLSPDRWQEYKKLRLEALVDSPTAFGLTEEEEVKKDDSSWSGRLEKASLGDEQWFVFLEHVGTLVGMAGAYREKLEKIQHNAYIVSVYVAPDMRGQGYAQKLMTALIDKIKANREIKRLELQVTVGQESALSLYKKLGFTEVGTLHKEMYIEGKYFDQIVMEKFL